MRIIPPTGFRPYPYAIISYVIENRFLEKKTLKCHWQAIHPRDQPNSSFVSTGVSIGVGPGSPGAAVPRIQLKGLAILKCMGSPQIGSQLGVLCPQWQS